MRYRNLSVTSQSSHNVTLVCKLKELYASGICQPHGPLLWLHPQKCCWRKKDKSCASTEVIINAVIDPCLAKFLMVQMKTKYMSIFSFSSKLFDSWNASSCLTQTLCPSKYVHDLATRGAREFNSHCINPKHQLKIYSSMKATNKFWNIMCDKQPMNAGYITLIQTSNTRLERW